MNRTSLFASPLLATVLLVFFAPACEDGGVGEPCDTPGVEEECADGAICDSTDDGAVQCLQICVDQEDCPADESCNGVSNSNIKACHPADVE